MSAQTEYSVDWQHMVVLLYSLDTMTGGIPRRRETVEYIQQQGFLTLRQEDHLPYRTQKEPSWQTDIAYARKDAVMLGFINNIEWDSWEIIRDGREYLSEVKARCFSRQIKVSRCSLWSPTMKRTFDETYVPTSNDEVPPPKGQRARMDLNIIRATFETISRVVSLADMAANFSKELGIRVAPTVPSLAFAWWTLKQNEKTER